MSEQSPGARAVAAFEIDDVFLVSAESSVPDDFNQTVAFSEGVFQHAVTLGPTILGQTRTPLDESQPPIHIVRYYVVGEVVFLRPEIKEIRDEYPADAILGRLKLKFAVDYRCPPELHQDEQAIQAFGRNALFHGWPYWREAVHEFAARMRLPRLTVPMNKPPAKPLLKNPELTSDVRVESAATE